MKQDTSIHLPLSELEDGRILHAAGTNFNTSDDGGITWSETFSCTDTAGNPVGGGGTSLVRLSDRRHRLGSYAETYRGFFREYSARNPSGFLAISE